MERILPDLNTCKLLNVLFEENEERNEANYLISLYQTEKEFEAYLSEILKKLNVQASVKSNKNSLPYQHEIRHTIKGGSFLNEAFDFREPARKIITRILQDNIYKLRFYTRIDILDNNRLPVKGSQGSEEVRSDFGAVEYRFRYYIHTH